MDKQFYVLYLIPSRPDFAQTMNDEEKAIISTHELLARAYEKRNSDRVRACI